MDNFLHYLTLGYLWEGAVIAIQLMVAALTGGILIGFFLALASLSNAWWMRYPVKTYIYLLRGTPVLLQLIILYNVLPQFGIRLSPFWSALLALTINETAYCAEIIRGGIMSANRDQRLAAQAFGFSRRAEMIHVVIPQALRAILPTLGNESVGLLKSTSLASVVGVAELTMRGQTIVSTNFQFLPVLLASGAIYIIMSSVLAGGQFWAENRVSLESRANRAARRRPPAPTQSPAQPARMGQAERMLDIHNLEVAYRNKTVLKDLSLVVKRSEVVVLLGRSGSGKSTLLKTIMALVPSKAGSIRVGDVLIGQNAHGAALGPRALTKNRIAARIGIVFQNFALFDHLTAEQNVMSIPTIVQKRNKDEARAAANRALAQVGLADFAYRLPHELSGGQQQRVAIARALASDPQLLLFDEPTSALDPELVREVNATIRGLADTGLTMVISTHDVGFARSVADTIVFLKDGKLVESGPPSILDAPQTETFAAYLRQEEVRDAPEPQRLPPALPQPATER
ncbi:amino acid ABC transporter permease/ATP-binding protein [Falsirhodobacter halotolerans]|uniref:amino acid ABC transporter permease/ATP-binding protein n=1 Tax=Falsirhodobacter halotolerans TaxID=1146892 RepID=UPI001FD482CF|nr:amino acid ABC transporter permease/ATP-binding protein [Falsirhodobacter halotolerans]MCJ8139097.1 amino acid ABC transporter permease/ATP-binding protein [Falsirhodobacter halotolerans]